MTSVKQVELEAIGWVIRLREASEQDWQAFTAWLETDPAHAAAYEEAALVDAEAEELLPIREEPEVHESAPAVAAVRADGARRHGRRQFLGWGIAASLLLTTFYVTLGGSAGETVIETGPGERREFVLGDGSRIELNGGTRIVIDEGRERYAKLERGEALFHVVHDAARPFEVAAGDSLLRDMGTVFNVVHEQERLEVAVSEGAVLYNPGREAKNLLPGMSLRKATNGVRVERLDPGSVGGWRQGRLVYSAAPVAEIAGDLSRNVGVQVGAAPDVATRPFTGVIMLEGKPGAVLARTAALLGLSAHKTAGGWTLTKASAPT